MQVISDRKSSYFLAHATRHWYHPSWISFQNYEFFKVVKKYRKHQNKRFLGQFLKLDPQWLQSL
jgi:hypothetical protein